MVGQPATVVVKELMALVDGSGEFGEIRNAAVGCFLQLIDITVESCRNILYHRGIRTLGRQNIHFETAGFDCPVVFQGIYRIVCGADGMNIGFFDDTAAGKSL